MKVIQVLPEMNAGGVESYVLDLATGLAALGVDSVVVSNGGNMVKELEAAGSRHIEMPVHKKGLGSLFQVRAMRDLLVSEAPDVVHYHSRVPGWISLLAWKSMGVGSRPRLVSTVHGFHSVNFYSSVMNRGERVIAVSESIKKYVLENYPAANGAVIQTVYEGVDPADYSPSFVPSEGWLKKWWAEFPVDGGVRIVLPGRMTRLKGHGDFVNLIARLKEQGLKVSGLIVGDTHPKKRAYRDEIEALVKKCGVEDEIVFLGHRSDLREIMTQCDVVVSLTKQPEAFGRVVLEGLALGKPVVGYDCGGVAELLGKMFPEGRVPLGDQRVFLEVLSKVLNEKLRPAETEDVFTIEAMTRSTLRVYEELVG